jgi:hypothetical protein
VQLVGALTSLLFISNGKFSVPLGMACAHHVPLTWPKHEIIYFLLFYDMVGAMIKKDLQQVSLDSCFVLTYVIREDSLFEKKEKIAFPS